MLWNFQELHVHSMLEEKLFYQRNKVWMIKFLYSARLRNIVNSREKHLKFQMPAWILLAYELPDVQKKLGSTKQRVTACCGQSREKRFNKGCSLSGTSSSKHLPIFFRPILHLRNRSTPLRGKGNLT